MKDHLMPTVGVWSRLPRRACCQSHIELPKCYVNIGNNLFKELPLNLREKAVRQTALVMMWNVFRPIKMIEMYKQTSPVKDLERFKVDPRQEIL